MSTIAGVFEVEEDLREAYRRLQDAGIPGDDIGVVMRELRPENARVHERLRDESGITGAGVGAAIGGTAGWVAGAGVAGLAGAALLLPVIGPVIAAGALAGIVSAAGGTLGWLAGGLVGKGMAEKEASHYQVEVEAGRLLLTVQVRQPEDAARVRSVITAAGGKEYAEA
ncbi:MAG: hypothetical protein JOZ39_12860 [Chloroflexi bacterium]|nr:hypothetical protein [Chloroflexota bacterium]